jgi:hypothetical protein
MATKRSKDSFVNPTIPDVSIQADGETYRLCFDFQALATAKAELKARGVEVNVLRSINFGALDVDTLPALFYASAMRYQPDLSWERAQAIVNIRTAGNISVGLYAAWRAAMVRPSQNPPRAARKN